MAQHDAFKHGFDDGLGPPIGRYRCTRFARKETVLKQEIESYYTSDVDNIAIIRYGKRRCTISQSLDLPDAVCTGLTYKQRIIQTERGDCLLLARWKPDRHMRRNAPEWSQKWFVEKQLFPPDKEKLFSRLEKRYQDLAEEAASAPLLAAAEAEEGAAAQTGAAGEDNSEEE